MSFVDKSLNIRQEVRRFVMGWFHPQMLALEKARVELNAELREHWKPQPVEVHELIREIWEPDRVCGPPVDAIPKAKENKFIVYIDPDFDVDWIADVEKNAEADKAISFAESIGAKRCKHLPSEQVLEFKRLVGQAIVSGIQGEVEYSRKLTEEAAQFLKDRTVERSRSWTLASAHLFVFLFSVAFAFLCSSSKEYVSLEIPNPILLWLAVQGGIVGAYLSVVQKAGRGEWDASAGLELHHIEVFTKLFAGGIFGGIALALSQSAHAPLSLKGITPDGYSVFLFGVAAGMFERLIPKMISTYAKFEKPQNNSKP